MLGFAGAIVLAVTRASLPFGAVAVITVASVVMIELGSAHLDGRSIVDRGART